MADRGHARGQRGGRGNDLGRGVSSAGGLPDRRICFDFQRGNCKRTNCKFSHIDRDPEERRNVTPVKPVDTEKQHEARKSYNAWKRFLASEPTDPSAAKRLWKGALKSLRMVIASVNNNLNETLIAMTRTTKDDNISLQS
jgi:hypothetical protein